MEKIQDLQWETKMEKLKKIMKIGSGLICIVVSFLIAIETVPIDIATRIGTVAALGCLAMLIAMGN